MMCGVLDVNPDHPHFSNDVGKGNGNGVLLVTVFCEGGRFHVVVR